MMGLDIPQSDSAAIFRFFDRDGSGVLELGELITELKGAARSETTRRAHIGNTAIPLLEASHGAARAHEQARAGVLKNEARRGGFAGAESYNGTPENRRVPRRPTPRSEVVLEVLRNFFRQRSFRSLLGAFRAQDHDRSGRFELPEFALALKALNLDLEDDDIAAVFASLDADGSGVLELSEFMNAMLAEPSADEARWLRLGIGKQQLQPAQGVPSIQKTRHEETSFTRELADSHSVTRGRARPVSAPVGRAALRASTGLPTGRPVETVMHLLRNYFGARPNTALVGAFREQDQDRSGRFSVLEFKAALRALNVDVTEGEAEDVFRHLDADGSGVLELSEFVNAMKAEAPPEETRWLRFGVGHHYVAPNPEPPAIEAVQANASGIGGYNRSTRQHVKAHSLGMPARVPAPQAQVVLEVLRNFFRQRPFRALLGAFRAQDHDRSGRFELPEFKAALASLNLPVSDDDLARVFASLDADGSGVLELSEFLNAIHAEPPAEEAQWLRLGIGRQQLQPSAIVPDALGVKSSAGESGFARSQAPGGDASRHGGRGSRPASSTPSVFARKTRV